MKTRSEAQGEKAFSVPHDPVNEGVVIAAAIRGDKKTREMLLVRFTPEHFLQEEHRELWRGLVEMRNQALEFSPQALRTVVGDKVKASYVEAVLDANVEVPKNLEHHSRRLEWDRQRAAAAKGPLSGLLGALKDPTESPARIRALARSLADSLDDRSSAREHLEDPVALVEDMMREIDERIAGRRVFPFGIQGLDFYDNGELRMTPGLAPGKVTVITGTPGSGKSTLAMYVALCQAKMRRRTLYGAWEMNSRETLESLSCTALKYDRRDLLDPLGAPQRGTPGLTPERRAKIHEVATALAQWVRFMRNPFRRTRGARGRTDANLDIVQQAIADSGCDVFIADLWSRCLVSRKPEDEEEALFRQQAMLEELGAHGVLVHQQRFKDVEQRPDKRPTREGIKGSGAYVEVADNMIGVHRPALFKRVADDKCELIVLKQRHGRWPLAVEMDYNGFVGSFEGGREVPYDAYLEASQNDAWTSSSEASPRRKYRS